MLQNQIGWKLVFPAAGYFNKPVKVTLVGALETSLRDQVNQRYLNAVTLTPLP